MEVVLIKPIKQTKQEKIKPEDIKVVVCKDSLSKEWSPEDAEFDYCSFSGIGQIVGPEHEVTIRQHCMVDGTLVVPAFRIKTSSRGEAPYEEGTSEDEKGARKYINHIVDVEEDGYTYYIPFRGLITSYGNITFKIPSSGKSVKISVFPDMNDEQFRQIEDDL